ncbi:hypothetical protein [Clostridium fallax]|uniref:Uncharacterized protein n=1 Tax=Clostridium fallax TaxID=1533 RepID=A0A1M4V1E8_9CLOT|nr:hypothetical protein [Clostridium fallax]SHE62785.1 hypothetical protein SAMN05443638_10698 [Clostridium fallax]SQB06595.1 Uncharacterised protein [Clostridium fallax]
MKYKKYFKNFMTYNIFLTIIIIIFYKLNYNDKIIKYILFNTSIVKFQDLLTVIITILSIFVGAVITVATVLISMCDKRILKLIKKYNKVKYLISSIKIAISTGILTIIFLAIIYSNCDFKIIYIRLCLLYISGFLIYIFIKRSMLLINLVIKLLNNSFYNDDTLEQEVKLKDKQ